MSAEADESMTNEVPITVARGDGIGPEIMDATLHILKAAGARHRHRGDRDRREGLPRGQQRGHRAVGLGVAPAHEGLPQGADHHAPGRRLQEPQRHDPQDARPLRQRPALRVVPPVRRHEAPGHGRRHRPRERGGPLRRHRVPADPPTSTQCLKLITRPGSREDRPLRLRVRAAQQPQEGDLLHQRQHHEDDRRPLPQGLRRDRRRSIRTSRTSTGSSTSARPSWPTRPRSST